MTDGGARLAIRLLQDAAERGDLDPWDVDVIAVIDGFLDQLRQRIAVPRLVAATARGGSYEQDLAETSEAFLAASVLVSLKAEVLEASTFPQEAPPEADFDLGFEAEGQGWIIDPALQLPRRPERHLWRRPVAPPPLQRPVTLGELIRQLEDIAERLEQDAGRPRQRQRQRRYSERAAIAQVAALAHREKLPETTAALSRFLLRWPPAQEWVDFERLVGAWSQAALEPAQAGEDDLDRDRVGVFWALLFLCHQGKVDLEQQGGLFGRLSLRRCAETRAEPLVDAQTGAGLSHLAASGSAPRPAAEQLVA
ncbi:segregation/condensation protein A [Cyanobium sp. NIES-981]|uniref:segregation/condensation protein A n=1 Tax=Cyanobium sp. NIES-981 TaxID=1851505 RepID=UPI0007DD1513|nr:segregation/condensation protein A [Cyanobium sp. NIES-981]SBO44850.1 Segregation and condensation protein A [Cyanobium sp. NIES-981]